MQLRLEPPADLRPPEDPEGTARHRALLAAWHGGDGGLSPRDLDVRLVRERAQMARRGWRYWIPDGTRMAARLGPEAPALLFAAGTPLPAAPAVAVVGTRRPDAYGLAFARALGRALSRAGATVVSGGALGIDGAAHQGALDGGGRTLVVPGGGLSVPHPRSHAGLFARVASSPAGSLASESPCLAAARPCTFPRRNRLLAALADAVVVVQAGTPSGALLTADWATRLDVPVYAVPADAWYERASGTLRLLRQGARPLGSPADLQEVPALAGIAQAPWPRPGRRPGSLPLPWDEPGTDPAPPGHPPADDAEGAAAVRAAVRGGAATLDEALAATGLPAGRVLAVLSAMEIAGEARLLPGGRLLLI